MAEFKRILVTKLRHHGDVLLTSPIFTTLRRYYPDAQIDVVVYAETADMLTLHPAIDNVLVIDRKWKNLGVWQHLKKELGLIRHIKNQHYDLLIHLTESMRGFWFAQLGKIPMGVTFENNNRKNLFFWCKKFQKQVKRIHLRHTVECHLDTLRALGIQPAIEERRLILIAGDSAEKGIKDKLYAAGWQNQPYVVVHPTSRWMFKCWNTKDVAAVMEYLNSQGKTVVLSAAPAEEEMKMVKELRTIVKTPFLDLSGTMSLKELSALIQHAEMLFGVDSVPMHIAAAMQTPVVALFGPTGDKEWGPWMVKSEIVTSHNHPCRPCGQAGCANSHICDCLVHLPKSQVIEAINTIQVRQ
ncbi:MULTISPECIES: putative lipopolysaccharide heptosyltransferase III [Mangrovibacter]|uniref:Heptosyltransferase-3 n=1 Tax=Mangrovibacter plantisponsor TaxID=451513 RepID=A0A317PTS7_9ENTR|nr:putative lipopolysaccharide heptosyltransferase III [Mangrovibacter plantisponsor]PWW05355.1 heptosyltransferase-3 [Mangrovibacter plantisponsor]